MACTKTSQGDKTDRRELVFLTKSEALFILIDIFCGVITPEQSKHQRCTIRGGVLDMDKFYAKTPNDLSRHQHLRPVDRKGYQRITSFKNSHKTSSFLNLASCSGKFRENQPTRDHCVSFRRSYGFAVLLKCGLIPVPCLKNFVSWAGLRSCSSFSWITGIGTFAIWFVACPAVYVFGTIDVESFLAQSTCY